MFVLFFKQKTAYELRISDWSSDVCSSDLLEVLGDAHDGEEGAVHGRELGESGEGGRVRHRHIHPRCQFGERRRAHGGLHMQRSEEHTSELQSLMRISYAVFCLKKKKQKNQHNAGYNVT